AAALGSVLARPWIRLTGLGAAACVIVWHHWFLYGDYPGAHLALVGAATSLAAASLTGARIPARLAAVVARLRTRSVPLRTAAALAAVGLAWTLVVWPRNAVLCELFKSGGNALVPFLARLRTHRVSHAAKMPPEWKPWLVDRTNAPPIAPSSPPL